MFIVLLAGGIYVLVIASFFYGWERLKPFSPLVHTSEPFISVIVAMRNEEQNIANLLSDLKAQNYNSFEVIVADDHSDDRSLEQAQAAAGRNVKIISLPDKLKGKKCAILYGVEHSAGDIIQTTDADCRVGKEWLSGIASFFEQKKPVLVMAPVVANDPTNLAGGFLSLEMFSLLGSTAGSAAIGLPVMCNGANMAYSRKVFPEIKAIYNNGKMKSGDDVFVMLELKKRYPGRVHFLKSKEATVYTKTASSIGSFFRQRGRWVSKAAFYNDKTIIFTALVVFLVNVLLLTGLIYGIIYKDFSVFAILLFLKSLIDFPFLWRVTFFFGQKKLMIWFPVVQSIYFLYVCISVLAGLTMPIGWKGRSIR